jgi:RNA polymerase sigma-70 factor, ECF subfamily
MELYARHGRALLRKAERMLGSRADAQDLVQGLFVDLLERGNADDRVDLAYLYRAVTNRCLTFLRDETNRARLRDAHDEALRGPVRTRCDDRVIDLDLLQKLARTLDDKAFEILTYRFFDDMTHEEIATMTGLSRKTVGKKLDDVREAVGRLVGAGGAPS